MFLNLAAMVDFCYSAKVAMSQKQYPDEMDIFGKKVMVTRLC